MNTQMLHSLKHLSDRELLARVHELAQRERQATAMLVAHLAELEARGLHLAEGCSSIFAYCAEVLHLSEDAAYGRIKVARAAREFPVLLTHLAGGSLTLTTVILLRPHLTVENHQDLLERARHKSKREVEQLIAALRPQPSVPDVVRKLPARQRVGFPLAEDGASANSKPDKSQSLAGQNAGLLAPTDQTLPPPAAPPSKVVPLAPERYKIQFTASGTDV